MKKYLFVVLFCVLIITIVLILNIRTPYCFIKNDFNKYKDEYKYITEMFEKQNSFNYVMIYYEYKKGLYVNYELLDEYKTTTFDDFFDNILVADKLKIKDLINKCKLEQIIFNKETANQNKYIKYVRWCNMKYARGIVYAKHGYNPVDWDLIDYISIDDNYYLYEEN